MDRLRRPQSTCSLFTRPGYDDDLELDDGFHTLKRSVSVQLIKDAEDEGSTITAKRRRMRHSGEILDFLRFSEGLKDGRFQTLKRDMSVQSTEDTEDGGQKARYVESDVKEYTIPEFLKMNEKRPWTVQKIQETLTAQNLCELPEDEDEDHIERIFKVSKKLEELAEKTTENTEFLQNHAQKVAKFAVELLDQVHTKEEAKIKDEDGDGDRYGSLFSEITRKAIIYGQKKFVSHPFLFKRVKMRWQRGSPFSSAGVVHTLRWLLVIVLETILTPFLLPLIGYTSYRDQKKRRNQMKSQDKDQRRKKPGETTGHEGGVKKQSGRSFEAYFNYINTPLVIFIKTEFMKMVFIALHCRICILGSSVLPIAEEYLVFIFFMAVMLSEYEQWRSSPPQIRKKIYFRDMWNWVDLLTMVIYIIIIILRVIVIIRGGDPFNNRLLEILNYFYGFNTMFLILRFSSLLELSSVFGPLQLALFRMCVDLITILVQFAFVVAAFSVALAKIFSAEMSFLISSNIKTEEIATGYTPFCSQGAFLCLYKAARQLVWSVFGIMQSTDLESHTTLTSEIVAVLYLIFLILSVIMLVNILVALLTSTYEKYRTNWEVEWKFGLAVLEEQYARRHAIVIPYNLLTYPILQFYFSKNKDTRKQHFEDRKRKYDKYFRKVFIPTTTARYKEKYQGSFSLSADEKLDNLQEKIEGISSRIMKLEEILRGGSGNESSEHFEDRKIDEKLDNLQEKIKLLEGRILLRLEEITRGDQKEVGSGNHSNELHDEAKRASEEESSMETENDDDLFTGDEPQNANEQHTRICILS